MRPGTEAASAHSPQLMVCLMVIMAAETDSGLAAMAVMNMAEEMQEVWKRVTMM